MIFNIDSVFLGLIFLQIVSDKIKMLTVFLLLVFCVVLIRSVRRTTYRFPHEFVIPFLLVMIICGIGIVAAYLNNSHVGLYPFKSVIRYCTYFLIAVSIYNSKTNVRVLLDMLLIVITLNTLLYCYELIIKIDRPSALFDNNNANSYFLVISNILFLSNGWYFRLHKYKMIVLGMILFTVISSMSLGGTATYFISIVLFIYKSDIGKSKKTLFFILCLIVLGGASVVLQSRLAQLSDISKIQAKIELGQGGGGSSLSWRVVYWTIILKKTIFNGSLLWGKGIESTSLVSPYFLKGLTHDPHNDFVRVVAETGLVGLFLYLTVIALIYASVVEYLKKASRKNEKKSKQQFCGLYVITLTLVIAQIPGNLIPFSSLMWTLFAYTAIVFRDSKKLLFT